LFRVSADGALADALVAVTRYQGHVPPASKEVALTIHGCAFSQRTVALHESQVLTVKNKDGVPFLPRLDGARAPATIVTVPGGAPITLHHRGPQRYSLVEDTGHTFMKAHVWVFKYATTSVTGLNGKYSIGSIPVGPVKVSAMLPVGDKKLLFSHADAEIKEGDNTLDLKIVFDAKQHATKK